MRSRAPAPPPWSTPMARASRNASPRSTRNPRAVSLRSSSASGVSPSHQPARMSQIVVENVQHTYRPPRGRPVLALDDVSLSVRTREFLALLGPSGCGKSTLLYLIGGFLPIEDGRILIEGKAVAGPGPDRGIVFQHLDR